MNSLKTYIKKIEILIILSSFAVVVFGAYLLYAQTPGSIGTGSRIQTTVNANIHNYAHTTESLTLGVQPTGSTGTVLGGPMQQDVYQLYFVDYDTGVDGWTTEGNMQLVPATTTSNPDLIPPSTPTQLVGAGVSSTQVDLNWYPSRDNIGVAGYNVFRNGTKIATINQRTYSDINLTSGTTYKYGIQAVDKSGNISGVSEISITVPKKRADAGFVVTTNNYVLTNKTSTFTERKADYACVLPPGVAGSVSDGPRRSYSFTIWYVNFGVTGCDGWVNQDFISPTPSR